MFSVLLQFRPIMQHCSCKCTFLLKKRVIFSRYFYWCHIAYVFAVCLRSKVSHIVIPKRMRSSIWDMPLENVFSGMGGRRRLWSHCHPSRIRVLSSSYMQSLDFDLSIGRRCLWDLGESRADQTLHWDHMSEALSSYAWLIYAIKPQSKILCIHWSYKITRLLVYQTAGDTCWNFVQFFLTLFSQRSGHIPKHWQE